MHVFLRDLLARAPEMVTIFRARYAIYRDGRQLDSAQGASFGFERRA
jgi:hypothetical protein